MYFRKDNVTLVKGSNPLNAVLQHMFSQITVKLDATNVSPEMEFSLLRQQLLVDIVLQIIVLIYLTVQLLIPLQI